MDENLINNNTKDKLGFNGFIKSVLYGILAAFIFMMLFSVATVQGQSMEPTLYDGDRLLVYKYYNLDYEDIVVALSKSHKDTYYLVKRVIGMPGDTIEYLDNNLYRNGILIDEYYLPSDAYTDNIKITLKDNEYFLCGDNRNNSLDSRSNTEGPFTENQIKGKIVIGLRF